MIITKIDKIKNNNNINDDQFNFKNIYWLTGYDSCPTSKGQWNKGTCVI